MKILIAISDSFCANFIKGQGRYLVEQGHEVVIVSGPGKEIDNLEKSEPVKIIRVQFSREISPWKDLNTLLQLIKIIRNEKPDIINAGNPKPGFLFSMAHLLFPKISMIFTLRGVRSDTLTGIKKHLVKSTEKLTCLFSDKVIVISPSLKEHAYNIGLVSNKEKLKVLGKGSSNGYDIEYFSNSLKLYESGKIIVEKNNIPEESFKLLFVGRITKDKGVIELLEALKICWELNANIQLIIAGRMEIYDPLPEKYYELIENNPKIHFLGLQLDVRPIYSIGDALVLYSHREGFGNVVIEASCFNLPTIVADIPGLRDTTQHMYSGIVVEPRNSILLSEAIMELYNNNEFSNKLGKQGRLRAVKYFQNKNIWYQQLELYYELYN